MNLLTTAINYWKQTTLYTKFASIVFTVLIVSIVIYLITPAPIVVKNPQRETGISYGGNLTTPSLRVQLRTTLPKVDSSGLSIYALEVSNPSDLTRDFAQKLSIPFANNPKYPDYYKNNVTGETIDVQRGSGLVTYSKNIGHGISEEQHTGFTGTFSEEIAKQTGKEYLANLLGTQLTIKNVDLFYLSHESTTDKENAEAVILDYDLMINETKLQFMGISAPYARVYLDDEYQVIRFDVFPSPTKITELEKRPIISESVLISLLESGQGEISTVDNENFDLKTATTLRVNKIELQYRTSVKTGKAYPYLLLNCTALSGPGVSSDIQLILPAVLL